MYLHTEADNSVSQAFYKRHGFEIIKCIDNYYLGDANPAAYILSKTLVDIVDLEQQQQ
jgi:ribosomal protein S18 acetylase RimI-like enzyme